MARVRGAAILRSLHVFEPSQLVVTVSDWYARLKVCLVTVRIIIALCQFYCYESSGFGGQAIFSQICIHFIN